MYTELTDKNKQELIENGMTSFDGATETEYQSLCQKADIFLANHMKGLFTNSVNTNAINNLSTEQLNQVADILSKVK